MMVTAAASPNTFRALVSGQRRGLTARLARGLLRALSVPYAAVMTARNRAYDAGWLPIHRVAVPVVSVGNLTLGGTGKTPLVRWLVEWYQREAIRAGIVSRGYHATAGQLSDEARELAIWSPQTPYWQNPDRVAAARSAIHEAGCQLIVLDDALQHRRIHRDLNLVVLDALLPFGCEYVFPRGLLREPLAGLRRADVVLLSRADAVDAGQRQAIHARVRTLAPQAAWVETVHRPQGLLTPTGERYPLDSLRGRTVAAFCGIGNPAGFRHTLESCGCAIAGLREFPDHHAYTVADMRALRNWAAELAGAAALVCTVKDLVKIPCEPPDAAPLWALAIDLEMQAGLDGLEQHLRSLLRRAAVNRPGP